MAPLDRSSRRRFLESIGVAGLLATAAAPLAWLRAQVPAAPPMPPPWWPSRWGAGDEFGASNWITPDKVLDSMKWVRDGKIYRLGRPYEQGMPLYGTRTFSMMIPGSPSAGPAGQNRLIAHEEFVAGHIGQVGTQFDGLGHIGIQRGRDGDKTEMRYYSGFTEQEMASAGGLLKLGIEKLKPIVTRGHLMDLAGLKGRMLDKGEEITLADIRAALARQDLREEDIRQGDAILFHTGWGRLWMKDNARYNAGEPGIGLEVARWVVDRGLCLTGADSWSVEVMPNPDQNLVNPLHTELIAKQGIFNHENLTLEELATDRKYQFVYVFVPVPIKGATGSPGCPIAIT
jgi:kynurenine formamidase